MTDRLWVTGAGRVAPRPPGLDGAGEALVDGFVPRDRLPPHPLLRRMDRLSRWASAAAAEAARDAGLGPEGGAGRALAAATDLGASDDAWAFLARIRDKGAGLANPLDFPNLVPNAPAGYAGILASWTGPSATFSHGDTCAEEALQWMAFQMEHGRAGDGVVLAFEGLGRVPRQHRAALAGGAVPRAGEGAAALVLEGAAAARARGAAARACLLGVRLGRGPAPVDRPTSDTAAVIAVAERAVAQAGLDPADVAGLVFAPADGEAGDPVVGRAWGRWGRNAGSSSEVVDGSLAWGVWPAMGLALALTAVDRVQVLGAPVLQVRAGRGGAIAALVWGPPPRAAS